MKRNNTMIKNYLLAAFLICGWSVSSKAQSFCVGTDNPSTASSVNTEDLAQSLTMDGGCSGAFAGITVDIGNLVTDGGSVWTLRIYQGDGFGGALLYTQTGIVITDDYAGFLFVEIGGGSGSTAFTPGAQYTFRISTTSTTNSVSPFQTTTSFYSGGQGYIDGTALATNGDILDFNIFTQATTGSCGGASRLYVKHNATGSNNGTSWTNAYTNLQSALDYAGDCPNIQEIWVSAGTYKPSKDKTGNASPSNPVNKTFYIDFPIAVYGGFAGTETMLSQRNVNTHVTILSGDLDNNDTANPATTAANVMGANASLVVHVENVQAGVAVDGFTITAANWASGLFGGGIANEGTGFPFGSSMTVRNCRMMGNKGAAGASIRGNLGSNSPGLATGVFASCTFSGNEGSFGGGIHTNSNGGYTNCSFTDCTFSSNAATNYGGAMMDLAQSGTSETSFTRCIFRDNSVTGTGLGGAISIVGDNGSHANHSYVNCIFWNNSASASGGAIDVRGHNSGQISTNITNCTFYNNTAPLGDAIHHNGSGSSGIALATIVNSIFWQNGDEISNEGIGAATLNYSLITTASLPTATTGSNNIFNTDPLFVNGGSGNFQLQNCSPARNSGTASGAPATDYANSPRPALGGYDMGAYEAQSGSAPTTYYRDQDNDGFGDPNNTTAACSQPTGYVSNNMDCNDDPATGGMTNPAATEVCDGVDNDCDNQIDETGSTTWYRDQDNDGFGNPAVTQTSCTQPSGYVANNTDCDDTDPLEKPGQVWYADLDNDGYSSGTTLTQCLRPTNYKVASELTATTGDCNDNNAAIKPGATEVCDGVDNDCDNQIDEGGSTTWYRDQDNDGFGNPAVTQTSCTQPSGYVANNTDCDDNDALEKPGQVWYADLDNDAYSSGTTLTQCLRPTNYKVAAELTATTGDCNDNNAAIKPGATETCNGIDDDCDTMTDEGVQTTYYRDLDNDGFGNPAVTQTSCTQPSGYVANNTDCDDNDALEKPGQVWYADLDNDGYSSGTTLTQCLRPTNYKVAAELTATTGDCNDNNAAIKPGATETCNGIDDDCDTMTDEGVQTTYYRDLDNDGFGNPAVTQTSCTQPSGYVANNTDCDDNDALEKPGQVWYADLDNDAYSSGTTLTQCLRPTNYKVSAELTATTGDCNDNNAAIKPGATETCNGIDDDCDTMTDEGVQTTYYRDLDNDGFGNPAVTQLACSPPTGYVANSTDCDDNDPLEKPGQVWFADVDNDGYSNGTTLTQCLRPVGYKVAVELTAPTGDCNDNAATIHPGATETCNGIDDDCDVTIDEGAQTTWYHDQDNDGFGNPAVTQVSCTQPSGYVVNNTDCDDNDALEKPGQVWYKDTDNDGYGQTGASSITQCLRPTGYKVAAELTATTGDCNDNAADINPAASEICDGNDNNCNGSTDEGVQTTYYRDMDGDGFGNPSNTILACSLPGGYVANNTDCNDANALEKPGQVWYKDTDNDGYSNGATLTQCLRPVGYKVPAELTATTGDCNDNNAAIKPGALEICDGMDNDCDGVTDEGVKTEYFADTDGDGFGDPNNTITECIQPQGYVANNDDCDDTDDTVNPQEEEICDDKDNDCNGVVDDIGGTTAGNWTSGDVGGANGSANFPPCDAEPTDVFTINATGFSTSSSDKLHAVYQELCGNGEIIARVLNVQNGGWAGIMLRETLDPGSKKVSLKTQLTSMIRREIRSMTNGAASILNFNRPQHVWLRLVRDGSNFSGFTSTDGNNWSFAFAANISMNGCIYAGLFSESINASVTTTATFDNVSIFRATSNLSVPGGQAATSLDGQMPELSAAIYPNPTEGRVTVSFTEVPESRVTIRVFNNLGEQVIAKQTTTMNEATEQLDLSQLADGVYNIQIAVKGSAPIIKRVVLAKASGMRR